MSTQYIQRILLITVGLLFVLNIWGQTVSTKARHQNEKITELVESNKSPSNTMTAEVIFRDLRAVIEKDEYAKAALLLKDATAIADKVRSVAPRKLVDALVLRIRLLSQRYPVRGTTQGAIGQRDLGRFYCFFKNDWSNGCVLLKGCNEPTLVDIAERETAQPQDAARQAALGDKWIELAKASTGDERAAMETRALQWYAKAYSGLTAEQKHRIDPMLTDAVSRQMNRNLGAPADPVDLFLKLDWQELQIALGLEFTKAHSRPSETTTFCHITVPVKNFTGMGAFNGLRAETRLLCTDGDGTWNVKRYYTDQPINAAVDKIINVGTADRDVRGRNSNSNIPRNAYIEYSIGGHIIYRAFLSKPEKQAWWLDETLIR